MSTSFLTLSTETIDQIFEHLFPKGTLQPSWPWILDPSTLWVPTDLLHCRSVCGRFKSVATRWIWRRLVLKSDSDHFQDVCKFLRDHPDIATDVRRLTLYYAESNKYDDGMDDTSNIIDILPLLSCLRHLNLHRTPRQQPLGSFSLRMPSFTKLHTLVLTGLDCSHIGLNETTKLTSIKHLYLDRCSNTHMLWASLPSIEVCGCLDQTTFLFPWQLLREVEISAGDCDEEAMFDQFALEFQTWRQDPTNIAGSPLTELALTTDVNAAIDIEKIVHVFCGQPLKKLLVSFVDSMSIFRLQQIVKAFPELEDLMVLADDSGVYPIWDGSIVEFAQMLGRFKKLRVLSWNYTVDPYGEEESESESESDDDGLHYMDGLPVKYWEGSEYNPESPSRALSPEERQSDVARDDGKATSTASGSSVRSRSKSAELGESSPNQAPAANTVASQAPFNLNREWFTLCRGFASCLGEHCPQLQCINFYTLSDIGDSDGCSSDSGVIRFERDSGLDAAGEGKMRFRGTFKEDSTTTSWATKSDM